MGGKLTKFILIAFLLFMVATAPLTMAALAENGGELLAKLANGAADMLGEWAK